MRYAWIEQHREDCAVTRMGWLLALSRTGHLQWRCRPPSARVQTHGCVAWCTSIRRKVMA